MIGVFVVYRFLKIQLVIQWSCHVVVYRAMCVVPPWFRGSTRGLRICRGHAMQRTPLPGGPVSQKWKENTKSAENTKRKCKVQKKKMQKKYEKKCEKSGKEKDEKEQERIPKRCSAVRSSRRNNGTMETQDLARLGELPMALASLRNFCPSMNLGHLSVSLSALPGQTWRIFHDFSLFIPFPRLFL